MIRHTNKQTNKQRLLLFIYILYINWQAGTSLCLDNPLGSIVKELRFLRSLFTRCNTWCNIANAKISLKKKLLSAAQERLNFAALYWVPSAGVDATGGKLFPPDVFYLFNDNYSIGGIVIYTQDTNYFIGGMIINTQDTNYSIGWIVINTQNTNYST